MPGRYTRIWLVNITAWLSPDLQEQVLHLLATECGRDVITEKELRPIASLTDWRKQRELWTAKFREVWL